MNKYKNYAIIILLVAVIILILLKCNRTSEIITNTIIETKVDTVIKVDSVINTITSSPIIIREIDSFEMPFIVDTQAILIDYYRLYIYKDSIREDSNYSLNILDSISKNKIIGRYIEFKNLRPTEYITNTTTVTNINEDKKHRIAIGGEIGGNENSLLFKAEGSYTNNRNEMTIGYDNSKHVWIGYKRVIFKR